MTRTFIIGLLFCSIATAMAQGPDRPAVLNAAVEGYIALAHDVPATGQTRYVFYRGETITGSAQLINRSPTVALEVSVPSQSPVDWTWLTTPPGVSVDVRFEMALYVMDAPSLAIKSLERFDSVVSVPSRGTLNVRFQIDTTDLPPGVYELALRPNGWKSDRRIITDYTLSFELRVADSLPARMEVLYRRAVAALTANSLLEADGVVDQMIATYPSSSMAFSLRGDIARRMGRAAEAARALDTARALIQSGKDELRRPAPRR